MLDELEELLADPKLSNVGIRVLRRQINCVEVSSDIRPTPEPIQLRHFREYSNYIESKERATVG